MKIHSESLMNIPLVRQMLTDTQVRFVQRGIDKAWFYTEKLPTSVSGFNPLQKTIYIGEKSEISAWLTRPEQSARALNEEDNLIKEVLFAVHDYLHIFGYLAICELMPNLGFGTRPVTEKNIEDFVFCHLLTEAVATVGLDYWYLSQVDLNEVADLGSAQGPLTTSYREKNREEFRRADPNFTVQDPRWFSKIARFYCDGVFKHFDLQDLQRSPMTLHWLKHELAYGEKQRQYCRNWLAFLSAKQTITDTASFRAPLNIKAKWKRDLIEDVGVLLWEKVKEGKQHRFKNHLTKGEIWQSSPMGKTDFRFLNLNLLDERACRKIYAQANLDLNFKFFFHQYVSQYDHKACDPQIWKLFGPLIERKDMALIASVFRGQKRLKPSPQEPRDLFILN